MNQSTVIREATEADSETIADIYNESIRAVDSTMVDQPIDGADILSQMRLFSEKEGYFVMERGEYMVGWGVIKRFGEGPGYAYTGETSVFLRRSETGKGYGTKLKSYVLEQCKAFGYHHLTARVWASNTVSIEYNKQFGYEVVGIQKEIGFMGGEWKDVALLQLVFNEPSPEGAECRVQSAGFGVRPYSNRGGYRYAAEVCASGEEELRGYMNEAKEEGYHHVLAWAKTDEVAMYESAGFEVVGIQREVYFDGNGWGDVVVMQYVY